jgi:hypothetical protein
VTQFIASATVKITLSLTCVIVIGFSAEDSKPRTVEIDKVEIKNILSVKKKQNGLILIETDSGIRTIASNKLGSDFLLAWGITMEDTVVAKVREEVEPKVTPTSSNVDVTIDNLHDYLKNKFGNLKTDVFEFNLEFTVYKNNSDLQAYDIWISIKGFHNGNGVDWDNNKISDKDKEKSLLSGGRHMMLIAKDVNGRFPKLKIKGDYDSSYYKYPNIKQDFVRVSSWEWANYIMVEKRDENRDYKLSKVSKLHWDNEFDWFRNDKFYKNTDKVKF